MSTPDDGAIRLAYERLSGDITAPNYLIAILLAAVPSFSDQTPLLSRAEWTDDGGVTWNIVVADGQRLVRIDVTGPDPEYGRRPDRPLQATSQDVRIIPLAGSVTKVEVTTKDTTGWPRDEGIEWRSTWMVHFADGTSLTLPNEKEAGRYDNRDRDQVEKFIHGFLALALPR